MKRMVDRRIGALLRLGPIRHRLFAAFMLLSLVPLLVCGYISYDESSQAIQQKTRMFATEIVKQVAANVQLQMAEIDAGSEALVLSDPVQSALTRYAKDSPAEKGGARADLTKILLDSYGSFEHFGQKYFLDNQDRVLDPQVFAQLAQGVAGFSAQVRPGSERGRPYWGTLELWGGQKSMAMVRQIYFKSDNQPAGKLFLGIQPLHFAAIFESVDLGPGSQVALLDARDGSTLVQGGERSAIAAPALLAQLAASLRDGRHTGFLAYRQDGGRFAAYSQVAGTGWYVVSILPDDALAAEAQSLRNKIVLIGLICLVCAIALAYAIARSISAPLEKLAGVMRETEGGNFALRMEYQGRDELALLAQKFNAMAGNIGQLHEQLESRVAERTRDLEQANLKLAALSQTDGLTGIANRRRFDELLERELQRAGRSGLPLALLMIDVDHFKSYNDFYGHQQGDACLCRVASLLQGHARRAGDLAARYGGEEFVMLAADTDATAAVALAESLRQALETLDLPHAQSPIGRVSVSIGVTVLTPDQPRAADLFIRAADKAMYRAKQQGRDQVVLASR